MQATRLFDVLALQLKHYPKTDLLCSKVNGNWQKLSTKEVYDTCHQLSAGLVAMGIGTHNGSVEDLDKVLIIANNRPEWIITDIAVQQAGAILVPVYPTSNPQELAFIMEESKIKYAFISDNEILDRFQSVFDNAKDLQEVFSFDYTSAKHWSSILTQASPEHIAEVEKRKQKIQTEDLATIIYTSGTTGLPKGVMLSHKNILTNIRYCQEGLPFPTNPSGRVISFLPLNHVFERVATYLYINAAISIYYAENLEKIGDNLKEVRPHYFTTVPRLLEKVYEKIMATGNNLKGIKKALFFWAVRLGLQYDNHQSKGFWYNWQLKLANKLIFSKWREALGGNIQFIITGGAACQEKLLRIFHAAKIIIYEGYGPTENSPVISANRVNNKYLKFGTVGIPIGDQKVKIAADGEICVKGDCVMMGYYKKPELTAATIIDGWLHTGDIGVWVDDIFLKITDRKKELFKTSGGKYVAPQPIENKLKESVLVEQAIIVGEGEKFVGALIVPAFESLKSYLKRKEISISSIEEALNLDEVRHLYEKIIQKANENFNKVEQVKKFILLSTTWTVDTGELTPKLSLKRKVVLEKYASSISSLYRN